MIKSSWRRSDYEKQLTYLRIDNLFQYNNKKDSKRAKTFGVVKALI